MIQIALHRLELALKFAKKYKHCKLKQISGHVIVDSTETNDILMFPCYTAEKQLEICIDSELSNIITFLKKQKVSKVYIDNEGMFINNTHIKINQDDDVQIDQDLYLTDDNFELISLNVRKMFDFVTFASTDPARLSINGVYIDPSGHIAATDGRRLITTQNPIFNKNSIDPIIVPLSALNQLKMIFPVIEFSFYRHKTIKDLYKFSDGIFTLYTTKQEGIYPDYNRCFPTTKQKLYLCNGNDLYKAITEQIFYKDFNISVDIHFGGSTGKITISSAYGFNRQIPLCSMSDKEDRVVKVNPYFFDFLKGKSCIKIKVTNDTNPIVFEDNDYKYVIMPMRE